MKFRSRCKFLDKDICPFSHVTSEKINEDVNDEKVKNVEKAMKVESESKIKLLSDEMKTLRKEFSNYVQTAKQKIHILENSFKQLKGQSS